MLDEHLTDKVEYWGFGIILLMILAVIAGGILNLLEDHTGMEVVIALIAASVGSVILLILLVIIPYGFSLALVRIERTIKYLR